MAQCRILSENRIARGLLGEYRIFFLLSHRDLRPSLRTVRLCSMRFSGVLVAGWALAASCLAASGGHVISFGPAYEVQWFVGAGEQAALRIKVRSLLVDGR